MVKAEWGGQANFASFSSQARGVAILFKKDLPVHIYEDCIYNDPSGNFTALNFSYESYTITLGCIYGPNQDEPEFYKNVVFPKLEEFEEKSDFTVIGGDWNVALNKEMDTFGYSSVNNEKAKSTINEFVETNGLNDIFRELNPSSKRYTWRQYGGKRGLGWTIFLFRVHYYHLLRHLTLYQGFCLTIL